MKQIRSPYILFGARCFPSLCIAIAAIFGVLVVTNTTNAASITFEIESLNGTINPITYSTVDGTFMTGPISVGLNGSLPSLVIVDQIVDPNTSFLTARTVMDVSFNDGRGGDLSGTAVIEESGTIVSGFTDISSGLLTGAGAFSGTIIKGRNPFKWEYDDPNDPESGAFVIWSSGPEPPPPRFSTVAVDLPDTFIDGKNIPLTFEINAHAVPKPSPVPEPGRTVTLFGIGALGLLGYEWRRRKQDTLQAGLLRRSL